MAGLACSAGSRVLGTVGGRTNNPYDLSRTPGGSSGGSAALVAAGGAPLSVGTDEGGSIRQPSCYTGIAGLKPSHGRIPRTGSVFGDAPGIFGPFSHYGPWRGRYRIFFWPCRSWVVLTFAIRSRCPRHWPIPTTSISPASASRYGGRRGIGGGGRRSASIATTRTTRRRRRTGRRRY